MSSVFDKILLSLGFMLFLTLLIGTRAAVAIDATYPNRFLQLNDDHRSDDFIHYMAKRRFLPTRSDLHGYINEDFSSENNDDDEAHLNSKRYFLKSKRYFLNSKREDE